MKSKANLLVAPRDAKTENEVAHIPGLKLKDGATSIFGIRDDGVPNSPADYYLPKHISNLTESM